MTEHDPRSTPAEVMANLAWIEEWLRLNLERLRPAEQRRLMEGVEALVLAFRRASD